MKKLDKASIIDNAVEQCKFLVMCSMGSSSDTIKIDMNKKNEQIFLNHLLSECPNINYTKKYDDDNWVEFSI